MVVVAFSRLARIWGDCLTIHSLPAFFFFFKVEISSRTLIPLFRPESAHSASASWDDYDRVFPNELCVSSFPNRFPTSCLDSGIVNPLRLRWVKVYACLRVTCHLHFWQNDQGLLCIIVVTQEWNGRRVRISTQSWLWRRKFSHLSCRDSYLQPFDHKFTVIAAHVCYFHHSVKKCKLYLSLSSSP